MIIFKTSKISALTMLSVIVLFSCAPKEPEKVQSITIDNNEYDPAVWGQVYPVNYQSWQSTQDPKPSGLSKYRRGWDDDRVVYDRLSEFPFAALLYHGWGFGIEYNEPRGHHYAVIDQIEIDQSRTSPGGVCLACKTPFHKEYTETRGMDYLSAPFLKAVEMLPEKHRELGAACIDCHLAQTMELRTHKDHFEKGMSMIGKTEFSHQETRTIACAQCHMTYYVPRDENRKVAGDVRPPWTHSQWGAITIENIIEDLLTDYQREEWVQKVTGFPMPYIRHPEFELFSNQSVHWMADVSCADCHMPYTRSGAVKYSDHNVTSPLKNKMRACIQCHTESADWLQDQVFTIQDRTTSLLIRAGYATAITAKLFEKLHQLPNTGNQSDEELYAIAKDYYKRAFLRVVFISAENSAGFHNPTEATRVLGDAIAFAQKSESLLRQILTSRGIEVPVFVDLELDQYLNLRGDKKLMFMEDQEFSDPFDIQSFFTLKTSKQGM
ncbi:MAG: ammonia-forming cytochrome c nitrite reductase subunit c552 [Candidatus Marinimicrobia bacterium]|nr:ammonia-forming cytochrome c nitrite reductase subunit c552 [Candidatus Neomarinimicrobiota bacterium]